jgi:hypothetical protein
MACGAIVTELTQAEYAAARGKSPAYISKLKRQGRLVFTRAGMVNVEASDRLIENTRDPARGGDRRPAAERGDAASAATPATSSARGEDGDSAYREAARRERIAKARLAELELAETAGQLVRTEQVERVLFGMARQTMEALLALPDRLCDALAVEADPFRCKTLLDAELRAIVKQMQESAILIEAAAQPNEAPA